MRDTGYKWKEDAGKSQQGQKTVQDRLQHGCKKKQAGNFNLQANLDDIFETSSAEKTFERLRALTNLTKSRHGPFFYLF